MVHLQLNTRGASAIDPTVVRRESVFLYDQFHLCLQANLLLVGNAVAERDVA